MVGFIPRLKSWVFSSILCKFGGDSGFDGCPEVDIGACLERELCSDPFWSGFGVGGRVVENEERPLLSVVSDDPRDLRSVVFVSLLNGTLVNRNGPALRADGEVCV